MSKDNVVPGPTWVFDEAVAECFDDMLSRSIPGYTDMRQLVQNLCSSKLSYWDTGNTRGIVDIGASRGSGVAGLIDHYQGDYFALIEPSKAMCEVLRDRFACEIENGQVAVFNTTYKDILGKDCLKGNTLVLSVLSLQFMPVSDRPEVLKGIFDSLHGAGMFIAVEKVVGSTEATSSMLVEEYHAFKQRNGYSPEDIARKAASLKDAMWPVSAEENERMFKNAGFKHIECFFRNLSFAGWVCMP